jgi:hypothetical protein
VSRIPVTKRLAEKRERKNVRKTSPAASTIICLLLSR